MRKMVYLCLVLILITCMLCACTNKSNNQNKDNRSMLQEYINLVPTGVLDKVFNDASYTIELVDEPGKDFGISHINGLTIPELNKILIKDDKNVFRQSVVHEIFHAYDASSGFISENEDFKKIYDDEVNKLSVTGYISAGQYKNNVREYFAEVGQMYVFDSLVLKSSAPESYKYIDKLLNPWVYFDYYKFTCLMYLEVHFIQWGYLISDKYSKDRNIS